MRITEQQKEIALRSLKEHGTLVKAAKDAGCVPSTLREERKRSPVFDRKVVECLDVGKTTVGDNALTVIESIAFGKDSNEKTRLTAALALANAFVPGFKGTNYSESKVDHNVRVITSIPRPKYAPKIDVIDAVSVKELAPVDDKRLKYNTYMRDYMRQFRAEAKVLVNS